MTAPDLAIDVREVSKHFVVPATRRHTLREHALDLFRPQAREELTVLDRVSVAVHRGEALGVMGRNGSGKSTLLKIIAGIYQPDAGAVTVRGGVTPVLELGVGFNPELSAVDNVYLLGTVMGLSLAEVRRALDDVLRFAEVERFARQKVQHFSSGMAARLAYAVAFQAVREILILDEIFAVGDAGFQAQCEARYRSLAEAGHTIVLVSHDPSAIANLCTRAVLLDGGRVVMDDDAAVVSREYMRLVAGPVA